MRTEKEIDYLLSWICSASARVIGGRCARTFGAAERPKTRRAHQGAGVGNNDKGVAMVGAMARAVLWLWGDAVQSRSRSTCSRLCTAAGHGRGKVRAAGIVRTSFLLRFALFPLLSIGLGASSLTCVAHPHVSGSDGRYALVPHAYHSADGEASLDDYRATTFFFFCSPRQIAVLGFGGAAVPRHFCTPWQARNCGAGWHSRWLFGGLGADVPRHLCTPFKHAIVVQHRTLRAAR